MLKLQMMAGTFPTPLPDKSSMFSFVVDEGLKMFGWQPLLYVVAAGADRVDMFGNNDDWEVAYYDNGKHIRNFPMPKGADNKPICIVQKLVDTEGIDHTTRVSIDIYSGTISCTGSVTRPVPFEAQGSIYQAKPVSIESMISRAGHSTLTPIKIQASR